MWHEHGADDLNWQPELQAERAVAVETLGKAAMYLTSIQYEAQFEPLAARLSDAHAAHFEAIAWLLDINKRIYEAEQ